MFTILYLNPAGYVGGAEKSLLDLLDNLDRKRFRPLVVLLSPGPLEKTLRERGIDCRLIPLPPGLAGLSRGRGKNSRLGIIGAPFLILPTLIRLAKFIRQEQVSLIHSNGIKAHLLAIPPALLTGRPLVWHFRDLPGTGAYGRIFRRLAGIFPRRVIANSIAVKNQLGGGERIRVVYNGVAIPPPAGPEIRSQARRELGLKEGEIAIGTIGHFAPLKGYEDFLRAIPLVLAEPPTVRFFITGQAVYPAWRDYRRRLEEEAARLELGDKLIFTGGRDDPGEILAALDIFVLPSRSEGFGRANLEAMAAGLPVVSTRIGGIPEVVIDGETGFLVPPRTPPALAAAVSALAGDEKLRERMGAAGRRRAGNFSIRKMAEGVAAVYDEILEES